MGPARAAELLFTGRLLDGDEAERIGLVNRAVPREQVLEATLELARAVAANAPLAVRRTKESLGRTGSASLEAQLDLEARQQALDYESPDLQEGIAAVRERRDPAFRGEGPGPKR